LRTKITIIYYINQISFEQVSVIARNEAAIQRYFFPDCFGATRLAMTYLLLFFCRNIYLLEHNN